MGLRLDPDLERRCLELSGHAPAPAPIPEKAFMAEVIRVAKRNGWRIYHAFDSRKSAAGYPDLTLAHRMYGVVFAELKTEAGTATPDQLAWLEDLRAAGARVYLWRPGDWREIGEVLSGG